MKNDKLNEYKLFSLKYMLKTESYVNSIKVLDANMDCVKLIKIHEMFKYVEKVYRLMQKLNNDIWKTNNLSKAKYLRDAIYHYSEICCGKIIILNNTINMFYKNDLKNELKNVYDTFGRIEKKIICLKKMYYQLFSNSSNLLIHHP